MSRALGRGFAAALFGALAATVWLTGFYGRSSALRIDFDRDLPRAVMSGIYPPERDALSELTFAWTAEQLVIRLRDLNRQVSWNLDLRLRGARRDAAENPAVSFYVDGVLVRTEPSTTDFADVRLVIPARPQRPGVTVTLRSSATFVPGPADPRPLGVMIDRAAVTPSGFVLPPPRALGGVALASAIAGALFAFLGASAGSAVGSVILLSAGLAALAARGLAPYTDFPLIAVRATFWIGVLTLPLVGGIRLIRQQAFRNTARFAIVFTVSMLLLRFLALMHPDMPIGDAMFHAHRFQDVLGGKLYFTSIAPGNYAFPYAPGLYVFAAPFAGLVTRGPSDMALLRAIVCVADAGAGLVLYAMLVHCRADRLAAAMAVAFYSLIPLGFGVITTGNLTNAFAQSLAVAVLAGVAWRAVRLENRVPVLLVALGLSAAFLAHTSTFAIVSVATAAVATLFWTRGGLQYRSPAAALVVALVVAVVTTVALYYAHFVETYRAELARIGAETATAAPDAGGRSIAARFAAVPGYVVAYFGVPALVLGGWGALQLWRRKPLDRLTIAIAGWAVTFAGFLALGVVTPVDFRHYLAAIPVVALAAALGASQAWAAGGGWRATAVALLSWTMFVGIRAWWSTLR